jgi:hypothetical protein
MSGRLRPIRVGLLAGLCAAWLLGPAPAAAQQQPPKFVVDWDTTEIFSNQLHRHHHLEPLQSVEDLKGAAPRDTLIIVFGDLEVLDQINRARPGGLARFRKDGGAILIASDRDDFGRLRDFHLATSSTRIYAPRQDDLAYKGNTNMPLVKPSQFLPHPIFPGLKKGLATNLPSRLDRFPRSDLQVLCRFDLRCWDQTGKRDLNEHGREVGAPLILGSGADAGPDDRVLFIAGHGMFINGMLAQQDNDNLEFGNNCVRWLTNLGQRKKVLFIVEGEVVKKLALPVAEPPLPPIPPVPLINALLRAAEEVNLFNELFLEFYPKGDVLRWVAVLGSVLLGVAALGRLLRGRLPAGMDLLLRQRLAPLLGAPPLLVLRHRAALRGNLWEAANALARQCFEGAALRKPEVPPVATHGPPEVRQRLNDLVRHLWRVAYGPPRVVLLPAFAALLAALDAVQRALANGPLAYPIAGPPAAAARPEPPRLVG